MFNSIIFYSLKILLKWLFLYFYLIFILFISIYFNHKNIKKNCKIKQMDKRYYKEIGWCFYYI